MLVLYFLGAILGGAVSGLSFDLGSLSAANLFFCILSNIFLMPVFVSIFVLISIGARQKAWLAILGSLGGGMLLFMTVGLITPLNSEAVNVFLCLIGSAVFSLGLGSIGSAVLKRASVI